MLILCPSKWLHSGGATPKNQNKPITYSDFLANMARWSSG